VKSVFNDKLLFFFFLFSAFIVGVQYWEGNDLNSFILVCVQYWEGNDLHSF
jgi:hypothetical protein